MRFIIKLINAIVLGGSSILLAADLVIVGDFVNDYRWLMIPIFIFSLIGFVATTIFIVKYTDKLMDWYNTK